MIVLGRATSQWVMTVGARACSLALWWLVGTLRRLFAPCGETVHDYREPLKGGEDQEKLQQPTASLSSAVQPRSYTMKSTFFFVLSAAATAFAASVTPAHVTTISAAAYNNGTATPADIPGPGVHLLGLEGHCMRMA
ncbi:hypothetical protein C8R47DRAFT_1225042 [Mycena vitilis]|nr:hypothetical protein C8R47DRAFT_1225042 [Mycena vitilis]